MTIIQEAAMMRLAIYTLLIFAAVSRAVPSGSLYGIVSDEFVNTTTWAPAADCDSSIFGPCVNGTTCCADPAAAKPRGACYKVTDCTQLKDESISLGMRLVRFDLETGAIRSSASLPLMPHSGASTRPTAGTNGSLFVQITRVGAIRPYSIAQYRSSRDGSSEGAASSPELLAECVLDAKLSWLGFDRKAGMLLGANADGTAVLSVDPVTCRTTKRFETPVSMVNLEPSPAPGLPPFAMPPAAVVDDLNTGTGHNEAPSRLYYVSGRALIGLELGTGQLMFNQTFSMSLIGQQVQLGSPGLVVVGGHGSIMLVNASSGESAPAERFVQLPTDAGVLWAVSAAQQLLLDQAENRSDPLRVTSTIEAVAFDGSVPGAVVYRSPALPMPCAPAAYSCMTNYFSFVDDL